MFGEEVGLCRHFIYKGNHFKFSISSQIRKKNTSCHTTNQNTTFKPNNFNTVSELIDTHAV